MAYPQHRSTAQRGTVLILVLGLITLFMALILSATIRVYNSGKTMATMQKNVQAYLMMRAATLYISKAGASYASPITIGDTFTSASFASHPQAHRLGWAHLKGAYVICAGGSTGGGTGKGASISTSALTGIEKDISDAMEIRYYYSITDATPDDDPDLGPGPYKITLQAVDNNTDTAKYPW